MRVVGRGGTCRRWTASRGRVGGLWWGRRMKVGRRGVVCRGDCWRWVVGGRDYWYWRDGSL